MRKLSDSVCILAYPLASNAVFAVIKNIVDTISDLSQQVIVVSGGIPSELSSQRNCRFVDIGIRFGFWKTNEGILHSLKTIGRRVSEISLIGGLLVTALVKNRSRYNTVLVFPAAPYLIPHILLLRLMRVRVLLLTGNCGPLGKRFIPDGRLERGIRSLGPIMYLACSGIVTEGKPVAESEELSRFQSKIYPEGCRFVDYSSFHSDVPPSRRNPIVLFVGRFNVDKGFPEVCRAAELVAKNLKNVRFEFCGDGPLEWMADELKDAGVDALMRGWVPHSELPGILSTARILVLPSRAEGLPSIVLESMASKTPVLTTPVGSLPLVIKDGVTGMMLATGAPAEIAARIESSIFDTKILDEMADNAEALVREHFQKTHAQYRFRRILGESAGKELSEI